MLEVCCVCNYISPIQCDLQDKRVVSAEEGEEVASQLGAHFIETSALNATGVEEAFQLIVTG